MLLIRTIFITMIFAGLASPAFADRASADACAAKLPPDAKTIYAATAPSIGPATSIVDELRSKVRPMVMSGKMSQDSARANAEVAGECLKLLK
jgi:hypothetical protein